MLLRLEGERVLTALVGVIVRTGEMVTLALDGLADGDAVRTVQVWRSGMVTFGDCATPQAAVFRWP